MAAHESAEHADVRHRPGPPEHAPRQGLHFLHHRLTEPRLRESPAAVDLRDQIEDFLATKPGALPPP